MPRCKWITARTVHKTRADFPNIKTSMGYIVSLQHKVYRGNKFSATLIRNVNFISFVEFFVITNYINSKLTFHANKLYRLYANGEKTFGLREKTPLFHFNPIQDGGSKSLPTTTSFSPATSTNIGISLQNFLTFSFNTFATLVWNLRAITSASPKLLSLTQDHPWKKWFF